MDYYMFNGYVYSASELRHHGVKGQKWGVRRYQNEDGTLTVAGRAHRASIGSHEKSNSDKRLESSKALDTLVKNYTSDTWGNRVSNMKYKIGNADDVRVEVHSAKGREIEDSRATLNFLKKYNVNKAREGIAKEYYDNDEYGFIDKSTMRRDTFKNTIKPISIDVYPRWGAYQVSWDDGGAYGYHLITDEGRMDNMKVLRRNLDG